MNKFIFTWDDDKDISNQRKHGISFEDAQTVFFDENAIEFDDSEIRIISARKATKKEQIVYFRRLS